MHVSMKTKLTLTVDTDAVMKAKRLAKKRGVSVSALFEEWSSRVAASSTRPLLGKRLRGRWKTVTKSDGDPRLDYLMEKHRRK